MSTRRAAPGQISDLIPLLSTGRTWIDVDTAVVDKSTGVVVKRTGVVVTTAVVMSLSEVPETVVLTSTEWGLKEQSPR